MSGFSTSARNTAQQEHINTLRKRFDECNSDIAAWLAVAIDMRGDIEYRDSIFEIYNISVERGFTVTARMLATVLDQIAAVNDTCGLHDMIYNMAHYSPKEIHAFLQKNPYLKTNGIIQYLRAMSTETGAEPNRAIVAMLFRYPAELINVEARFLHESLRSIFTQYMASGECDEHNLLCTVAKTVELRQHFHPKDDLASYIVAKLGTAKLVELDSWLLSTEQLAAHKLYAALSAD